MQFFSCLWFVNLYLKSYIFCIHFVIYLHVWIRIRIRITDPGRSWIRIQYRSESTALVNSLVDYLFFLQLLFSNFNPSITVCSCRSDSASSHIRFSHLMVDGRRYLTRSSWQVSRSLVRLSSDSINLNIVEYSQFF